VTIAAATATHAGTLVDPVTSSTLDQELLDTAG
jgi:hypothetical protein